MEYEQAFWKRVEKELAELWLEWEGKTNTEGIVPHDFYFYSFIQRAVQKKALEDGKIKET